MVPCLVREEDSPEALALLRAWQGAAEFWVPDLLFVECANALRKKVVAETLARDDARRLVSALGEMELNVVPGREIATEAFEIALSTGLLLWDACYVAAARRAEAELWTADNELYAKGRQALANIHLLGRGEP